MRTGPDGWGRKGEPELATAAGWRSVSVGEPIGRAEVERSAQALADGVVGALRCPGSAFSVADAVAGARDERVALAAIRVVGPDVLAPFLFSGIRPGFPDVELVERCHGPAEDFGTALSPMQELVSQLRDQATGHALALLGSAPRRAAPVPAEGLEAARRSGWPQWSLLMSWLAPLTVCAVESAAHDHARRHALDLGRGVVRSMLRRDYPVAARLARWLTVPGVDAGGELHPEALVRQLGWHLGQGSRARLDVAIAEQLIRRAS